MQSKFLMSALLLIIGAVFCNGVPPRGGIVWGKSVRRVQDFEIIPGMVYEDICATENKQTDPEVFAEMCMDCCEDYDTEVHDSTYLGNCVCWAYWPE